MKTVNFKFVAVGLFAISLSLIAQHFIEMTDLIAGASVGIGLGIMLIGFKNKFKRVRS